MNAAETNSVYLPATATAIYLGALFLILGLGDFGSPAQLPRAEDDHPLAEITSKIERFGWSIAGGSDFDGDGVGDLLVGQPQSSESQKSEAAVNIFSMAGQKIIAPGVHSPWKSQTGPTRCGILSDLDADGTPDFGVGFQTEISGQVLGCVEIISGKTQKLILRIDGPHPDDHFGQSFCDIPDLNGDGVCDLAIGAPGSEARNAPGNVYIYSGRNGKLLRTLRATNRFGDRFGFSVAAMGDMNKDGQTELAIGAPGISSNGYHAGAVFLYSLANGEQIRKIDGRADESRMGTSVINIGDQDKDGVNDFAVANLSRRHFSQIDAISGASGATLFSAKSESAGDSFGFSLCLAGDVNGDSFNDIAVGAPQATQQQVDGVGYVRLISGKDGSLIRHIRGSEENEHFGFALAPANDQNKDGLDDIFISSPMTSDRGGKVSIFGAFATVEH